MSSRRRAAGSSAQAVLETALVIPVVLLLVCNFLGVMVMVSTQERLDAAVALAAESRFQAPTNQFDPPGAMCCPDPRCCHSAADATSLRTGAVPTGCRYAAETFYGTMGRDRDLVWDLGALCRTGGDSGDATHPASNGTPYASSPSGARVSCVIGAVDAAGVTHAGFLDRALNPPAGLDVITCDATARLDFGQTPLAWGVFWSPTLHAHAEVLPPPFRQ